ncbi:MAG: Extracellular solute-binding protein family 1 [Marinimicrobia bacterium 46_47]|nr:MAG: Extracellular solute-binding protein family 1 [Marinimicrobia bacterium 46_47]KUK89567.1 MAG: family 1 extracellular solute-binding protein [Marinimicrobia bacterium 46_43]HBY19156.1 ABC transporter substrate-binding protein [Candidatus Neomarinimicrobiota bacterium]
MKKILILLVILMGVAGVLSCDRHSSQRRYEKSGIIQLTYWCSSNQNEINLAQELVDQWNAEHPDIQVILQPIPASQSSEEVLLAAIAGKTTPDICSNIWPGAMDDFTNAGGLVPLNHFPDFFDVMASRIPMELLNAFQSPDSHYYQIPWKTNPIMVMYNVRLFREAGIEKPPATYSEYLDAARLITKDLDGDGHFDQWMGYRDIRPIWWQRFFDYYTFYIAASGGKTLFDKSDIVFNNDASVKVFQFFQELYAKGYYPRTTFQGDQFVAGKLATQFTGPWNVIHIQHFAGPDFEFDISPIPVPDDTEGPVYTYGDHKNIALFSTTEHPEAAWEFAKFLITPRADLRLLELCSQIPLRQNLTDDPLYQDYFTHHPRMVKFAEQAPYTRGVDGASDLKEIFDGISQEYEACAVFGLKSPEQAVKDAAKRAEMIIEWNRSR